MSNNEKEIYKKIYEKKGFENEDYSLEKINYIEKYKYIKEVLIKIIENELETNNICDSYNFILQITKMIEHFGYEIEDILLKLNSDCDLYIDKTNFKKEIAFATTYALSVLYYRYKHIDKMHNLLIYQIKKNKKYKEFILYFELFARYCLEKNFVDSALIMAWLCNNLYKQRYNIEEAHVGLQITYVTALCSYLEQYTLFEEVKKYKSKDKLIKIISKEIKDKKEINFENITDYFDINKAKQYINNAIEYSEKEDIKYPKYYYLKAKLLYYYEKYNNMKSSQKSQKISPTNAKEINEQIKKCLEILEEKRDDKDYHIRKDKYIKFQQLIEDENKNNNKEFLLNVYNLKKMVTMSDKKDELKTKDLFKVENNPNKVFVSYSSNDFKSVYCDMIELYHKGVNIDIDIEMKIDRNDTDYKSRQKWFNIIEKKIKTSDCVLCYISENYIISEPVLHEIKMIEKYNKPTILIDLTGKILISNIIKSIFINNSEKTLSSEVLKWHMNLFSDSNVTITKGTTIDTAHHINTLISRIANITPFAIKNVKSEYKSFGRANKEIDTINEDNCIADDINKIYIVVDGISRKREEYKKLESKEHYIEKLSKEFSCAFIENYRSEVFQKNSDFEMYDLIKDSFDKANTKVKEYINSSSVRLTGEKPGCVGVVAGIFKDKLYYGYFGDCSLFVIRNNTRIILADSQTKCAFELLKKEKERKILEKEFVNKNYKYGYCVANGDPEAKEDLKIGHFGLESGDIIFLCSDGLSKYLLNVNPSDFANKEIDEIYLNSYNFELQINEKEVFNPKENIGQDVYEQINEDAKLKNITLDDRSIIRIYYGNKIDG